MRNRVRQDKGKPGPRVAGAAATVLRKQYGTLIRAAAISLDIVRAHQQRPYENAGTHKGYGKRGSTVGVARWATRPVFTILDELADL